MPPLPPVLSRSIKRSSHGTPRTMLSSLPRSWTWVVTATGMRRRAEGPRGRRQAPPLPVGLRADCDRNKWLMPSAHEYSPSPNTECVMRLFDLAYVGWGVLDATMPSPSAGCTMK